MLYLQIKKTEKTKTASKANTQPSTEYCSVRMPIIIILSIHGGSKSTTSCVLLSMSTMSSSNFEYGRCEYNIKISMNEYKYQKLCVWFESIHRFEYSLLICDVYSIQRANIYSKCSSLAFTHALSWTRLSSMAI